MKNNFNHIEDSRLKNGGFYSTSHGDRFGMFIFPRKGGSEARTVVDDGSQTGWEHVSISIIDIHGAFIMPTWDDMCWMKDLFWDDDECVVQFHPKKSEYVNDCGFCLHLWKQLGKDFQTPPSILVGINK